MYVCMHACIFIIYIEERTDNLNKRIPQVLQYIKTLPPPSKGKRKETPGVQGGAPRSPALAQLEELRLKRLGQWPPAKKKDLQRVGPARAGVLGEGDERESAVRQLETMTKLCVEYAELGMMLMVCGWGWGCVCGCVCGWVGGEVNRMRVYEWRVVCSNFINPCVSAHRHAHVHAYLYVYMCVNAVCVLCLCPSLCLCL
jgi:hypothetical protein